MLRLASEFQHALNPFNCAVERINCQSLLFDSLRDSIAGGDKVCLLLADENHVRAGFDGAQGSFGNGERLHHRAHLHVVRNDESIKFENTTKQSHDDVAADGGGKLMQIFERGQFTCAAKPGLQEFGDFRERAMTYHQRL